MMDALFGFYAANRSIGMTPEQLQRAFPDWPVKDMEARYQNIKQCGTEFPRETA